MSQVFYTTYAKALPGKKRVHMFSSLLVHKLTEQYWKNSQTREHVNQ
ncbi:MAG TPA: hypothetical protein VMR70_21030 [Flavisolibacter sp.]|nr:hypothetical protein [Flavisolibacter sp.]